jgi:hypothetical protein
MAKITLGKVSAGRPSGSSKLRSWISKVGIQPDETANNLPMWTGTPMACVAKFSNLGLKSSIRGTIQKCNVAQAIPNRKPATNKTHAAKRSAVLQTWARVENFNIQMTVWT